LFGLVFDPDDGGDLFVENVCWFNWTTRRYIPWDNNLRNLLCKNLKSYKFHTLALKVLLSLKSTVFWNVILCSLKDIYWYFGGVVFFHLQGRRESHLRNQLKVRGKHSEVSPCLFLAGCLRELSLNPEDGGTVFLRNVTELVPDQGVRFRFPDPYTNLEIVAVS
jgi:hypothetical protein